MNILWCHAMRSNNSHVFRAFFAPYDEPFARPPLEWTGRHLVWHGPILKNGNSRSFVLGYYSNSGYRVIFTPPIARGYAAVNKIYLELINHTYMIPSGESAVIINQFAKGGVASSTDTRTQEVLREMAVQNKALDAFKTAIIEAVKEMTHTAAGVGKEESKLSEKAEGLISYIDSNDFGCRRNVIKGLVSLLIGEHLPQPNDEGAEAYWPSGTMIVPVRARGQAGHNYPENRPCLMCKGPIALKQDGMLGNSIDRRDSPDLRVATDEEIDAFFAALPSTGYQYIMANIKLA